MHKYDPVTGEILVNGKWYDAGSDELREALEREEYELERKADARREEEA